MIFVGLLLVAVSGAATMFFGAMLPKDDMPYDSEKIRCDLELVQTMRRRHAETYDNATAMARLAQPGEIAALPDGSLAIKVFRKYGSVNDGYLLGDGSIRELGAEMPVAGLLRGPFHEGRD
jgi:hypothetical protein